MKAKPCSHLGFPEAAGLFQTAPCVAGPAAKLVEKPTGEGRWPKMLNWGCSLGSPGRGGMKAGPAWWVWVCLHWIHALI